jgi:hypothetical protein
MFKDKIFGVIYIIKHKTDDTKKVYVGSTNDLKQRIRDHRHNCNNEKNKKYNINLYKYIRENGGFYMYEILILECYVCNFKYELYDREDDYIQMYDNNLNTFRAYLTRQEYKKKYIEQKKIYYEEHKEEIIQKQKKYYEENKDKVIQKVKKYREEHKEQSNKYSKKYRDENKNKINEKITCECGIIVTKSHIARHRKTLKHIAFIDQKNNVIL